MPNHTSAETKCQVREQLSICFLQADGLKPVLYEAGGISCNIVKQFSEGTLQTYKSLW